jgi:hypothetical protein
MKKILFLSLISLAFATASVAQDKASDIKKLFGLMNSEKMIGEMMNNMLPALIQQATGQIQNGDVKAKLDAYMESVIDAAKELSYKVMNEEMPLIYDRHFSHDEIKDLIKFYESPTGKKILEITPELTKDVMNVMMTRYMPEFQAKMMKELEKLK